MNFVGKILIVLICVLSLVFMTMAMMLYATHTNWFNVVMNPQTGLKYQLEQRKNEYDNLQVKLENAQKELTQEKDLKQDELTKAETTINQLLAVRQKIESDINTLNTNKAKLVAAMDRTQKTLSDMREEVATNREKLRQAQEERDAAFKKGVELADEVHQRETELKRLRAEALTLAADDNRLRELLIRKDTDPDEDPSGVLPPVSGKILAVVGKGSVELSIGSDDGLRKGHRLEVFRMGGGQNRYIGRIEVVDTAADRAVARIMPEYRKAAVREGDEVTSKF